MSASSPTEWATFFYGNVCWNNSTGIDLYTSSSTPTTANITFMNNIIANSITRAVHIEAGVSTSTLVFDNNNYDFGSSAEFLLFSTADTLSGWQSATGLDSHSLWRIRSSFPQGRQHQRIS